jgi:hypothetical protein
MIELQNSRPIRMVRGSQLDAAELPPRTTTRWVARRKAQVVVAVESGRISLAEAMERYRLSQEEFQSWQRAMDRSGVAGLKIAAALECRKRGRSLRPRLVLVGQ